MDKWKHIFGHNSEYASPEKILADLTLEQVWTRSPERLTMETDPGLTMADNLVGLAIHNAYHFGKIVAIRQMMGVWPLQIK